MSANLDFLKIAVRFLVDATGHTNNVRIGGDAVGIDDKRSAGWPAYPNDNGATKQRRWSLLHRPHYAQRRLQREGAEADVGSGDDR